MRHNSTPQLHTSNKHLWQTHKSTFFLKSVSTQQGAWFNSHLMKCAFFRSTKGTRFPRNDSYSVSSLIHFLECHCHQQWYPENKSVALLRSTIETKRVEWSGGIWWMLPLPADSTLNERHSFYRFLFKYIVSTDENCIKFFNSKKWMMNEVFKLFILLRCKSSLVTWTFLRTWVLTTKTLNELIYNFELFY